MSRKIDNLLDTLERQDKLTSSGRNWLVTSCDPFHDKDVALDGYPDLMTASTTVQLVKKQIQIAVPTTGNGTVPAGQNWDCSIAWTPELVPQSYGDRIQIDQNGNIATTTGVAGCGFGGIQISAGPQGQDLWPNGSNLGTINATSQALGIPEYVKGNVRVIAAGFEVVNTTSTLNKQGQLTAYRVPNHFTPSVHYTGFAAAGPIQSWPSEMSRLPPANIGDATLLPGSRTWAAEEGAYVVARQNGLDNPMLQPSQTQTTFPLTDVAANTQPLSTGAVLTTYIANQTSDVAGGRSENSFVDVKLPFDISGVHLTGLSYTTTLTVNARWYVERMPSTNESDLVVLATPAAKYDPIALELYARALGDMPPGVRLAENPLGEWFSSALSKVADWAPKIGSALGTIIPGASTVGNIVGGLSRAGSNLLAPKQVTPNSASPMATQSVSLPIQKATRQARRKIPVSMVTKSRRR